MNYWDLQRELQRIRESLQPLRLREPYADLMRQIEQSELTKQPKQVAELARFFETTRIARPEISGLTETSKVLNDAIQPFVNLRTILDELDRFKVQSSLTRLNNAIQEAQFTAEFDFSGFDDHEEGSGPSTEQIENELIEIAPAETVQALQRVEYVPISRLNAVLHDPDVITTLGNREFEEFIATLIDKLGFEDVVLTPRSSDGGRDVLATLEVHGIRFMCAFECKQYAPDRPVGVAVARALLGSITHHHTQATKGILVTTSHFTRGANRFILTEPRLEGRDFDGIVGWLREYGARQE